MKLSLKQVIAVSALAAVSGSALADAVVPGGGIVSTYASTTDVLDNGGLMFSLFSKNADTVFSLNNFLGLSLNDVVPTQMDQEGLLLTWHIEGLSNVPGSVAASDLVWGVSAADKGSLNVANTIRLLTTVNTGQGSKVPLTNQEISNVTGSWQNTVTPTNNAQNNSPVDFTTTFGSPTDLQQNFNTHDGTDNYSWVGALTDPLAMYLYSQTGGRGNQNALSSSQLYAGTWTFNLAAATLTYAVAGGTAPVPLPAAAWLLFSGLTGLGVIGRRKGKTVAAVAA